MQAVVGVWDRGLGEVRYSQVKLLSANDARRAPDLPRVAVTGYLMEVADERYEICAAGYVSIPPSCGDGNVSVAGVDPATWNLDEASGRRFSRAPVVMFGRLRAGELILDE